MVLQYQDPSGTVPRELLALYLYSTRRQIQLLLLRSKDANAITMSVIYGCVLFSFKWRGTITWVDASVR
jgi:hypothetical protein